MRLIAHRGASAYAPENTISAFQKAIDMGLNAVEFDVQFTLDGKAVVTHDYNLERTSNGSGYIKDFNLSQLRELDFGKWFDEKYINEKIPTLEEVLSKVKNNYFINIELKRDNNDKRFFSKTIIETIEKFDIREKVLISSFDHNLLKDLYKTDNNLKIALLFPKEIERNFDNLKEYIDRLEIKVSAINPHKDSLNEVSVKNIKKLGLKINSYTINEIDDYTRLKNLGVDAVFTNFPDLVNKNI
jgi:glycerophosphoryl diester phosphodiesterase